MSNYAGLGELVEQIKEASRNITLSDARKDKHLDELSAAHTRSTGPSSMSPSSSGVSAWPLRASATRTR
jgi:hypothetical protein